MIDLIFYMKQSILFFYDSKLFLEEIPGYNMNILRSGHLLGVMGGEDFLVHLSILLTIKKHIQMSINQKNFFYF